MARGDLLIARKDCDYQVTNPYVICQLVRDPDRGKAYGWVRVIDFNHKIPYPSDLEIISKRLHVTSRKKIVKYIKSKHKFQVDLNLFIILEEIVSL